jgi:hypothetical protein
VVPLSLDFAVHIHGLPLLVLRLYLLLLWAAAVASQAVMVIITAVAAAVELGIKTITQ